MASGKGRPWFIGCACDRKFAEYLAVMLASVDANGAVPEATILVAAFDLDDEARETVLAGAGRMAGRLRFVDITRDMVTDFAHVSFRDMYPLPVLGRLFLPDAITVPHARLVTIDADMIVNESLRPLFEMDMADQYIAAIHDVPRDDLDYFNSGLMVIEVDPYKGHAVGRRALRWLAAQTDHPTFPDQDALNHVVGKIWYRLDRRWNWFYTGPDKGDRPLHNSHYESAAIAHYAGGKPWNYYGHAGRPLFDKYRRRLETQRATREAWRQHVDANFVITAHEVLLGRPPENAERIRRSLGLRAHELVTRLVRSADFARGVVLPLRLGGSLPPGHVGLPDMRARHWVAERLGVEPATAERVIACSSWRELFELLLGDATFAARTGLSPLLGYTEALLEQMDPPVPLAAGPQMDGRAASAVEAEPVPLLAGPDGDADTAGGAEADAEAAVRVVA